MSAENYPDTMSESPERERAPKFGVRWWVTVVLVGAAASFVWRAVYDSSSIALAATLWAVLLLLGITSYRRFTKRARRGAVAGGSGS